MTMLRFSTMLLTAACLLDVHSLPAADVEPPVAFSPQPTGGGTHYFSLALPAGWQLVSDTCGDAEDPAPRNVQFVYRPPSGETPYLFVNVSDRGAAAARQQLEQARSRQPRRFLSGGEAETDYFDSGLNVLWRVGDSRTAPSVSATGYGQRVVTFKFFHEPGRLGGLAPTFQAVVENLRVYAAGEDASDYQVSAGLFATPEESWLSTGLLWGLPVALVVLFAAERTISRRRHREEMAKIDADVAGRKAEDAKPHPQLADAEAYYREALAKRRKRSRGID